MQEEICLKYYFGLLSFATNIVKLYNVEISQEFIPLVLGQKKIIVSNCISKIVEIHNYF